MICCNHHEKANRDKIQLNPFAIRSGQGDNNPENLHKKRSVTKKNNIGDSMIRSQKTEVPIQSALPLLTKKPRRRVLSLPLITTRGAIMACRQLDDTFSCSLYCVTQSPARHGFYCSPNCTVLIHRNLNSRTRALDRHDCSQIHAQAPSLERL